MKERFKIQYKDLIFKLLSGIIAFFGVCAINKIIFDDDIRFSNSIITVFCWIVYYKVFQLIWKRRESSNTLFCIFGGGIFSILYVIGNNILRNNSSAILDWKTLFCIIGIWPLLSGIIRWIEYTCKKYAVKCEKKNWFNVRKYFLIWGVILLGWIPIWFADFPGVYGYDAVYQTIQFYAKVGLNGHHPVAHTSFAWFLLSLGKHIFGTYEAGMALYAFIQMMFMSSIFAYTVIWVGKYHMSFKLQVIFVIFYAVVPIHGLLAISFTKDVMFSGFFLIVIIILMDIIINPTEFWGKKGKQLSFIIAVFFMCLFRNNGIYGFLVCIPFFVWEMKKYWKRAVGICFCCVLLYGGFMGPFSTVLDIEKGSFREALSIPMQQMSRAMLNNTNELTNEEKEYVEKVIPNYRNYLPRISDNVKNTFQQEAVNKDMIGFFKNWISIGIKCPITYVDAFLENSIAFWYPDMQYPDPFMWHSYLEYENTPYDWHSNEKYSTNNNWLLIEKNSLFPHLDKVLHEWVYTASHQKWPIVSMLFSPGFYIWIFLLTLLACIFYKTWKFLPVCMMMFGFWGTILLGPAALVRYAYPIIANFPCFSYSSQNAPSITCCE